MQPTFLKATIVSSLAHGGILAVFFFLMLTPTDRVMVGEGVVEVAVIDSSEGSTQTTDIPLRGDNFGRGYPSPAQGRFPHPVSSSGNLRRLETQNGAGNPTLTAIWKKINRAKYYPLVAREQKLEGAPRVQFQIGNDGNVTNILLIDSSGSTILDDAALETIRRAAPLPSYPESITLAIRYSLTD